MPTQSEIINANFTYLDKKIDEIELFKFPNAIITGNPTIDHGQVSNFSNANFLQFPFLVDLTNRRFRAEFCFTTGDDVTTQQNVLDSEFGLALAIKNGKGLMAIGHNGTSWAGQVIGNISIQPRTTYYAKLSWSRMNYQTQLSTNGTEYTADMNFGSTQSPYPRTMFIGGSPDLFGPGTAHPFKGSINLNKCFFYIEEQLVWQGMDDAGLATRADISLDNLDATGQAKFDAKQDKLTAGSAIDINNDTVAVELFDRNKFQVVGTPTITEDGIASGFSSSNYMQTHKVVDFNNANTWQLDFCFTTPSAFGRYNTLYSGNISYNGIRHAIDSTGKLIVALSSVTSEYNIGVITGLQLTPNTKYYSRAMFDGIKYSLLYSTDGITYNETGTSISSLTKKILSAVGKIGVNDNNDTPMQGFIDLKQFSITLDGVEVFSGANTIYNFLKNKQDVLYNKTKDIVSGTTTTIKLQDDINVYNIKPTTNTTLVFDTSSLTKPDNSEITFYLNIDMSDGVVNIGYPSNNQWGNISPTTTAMVHYKFCFTSPNGGTTWIGNQMFSWEE